MPYVLKTEFGSDPLFEHSKTIYTPEDVSFDCRVSKNQFASLSLDENELLIGKSAGDAGRLFADAVICPPGYSINGDSEMFSENVEEQMAQAIAIYDSVLNSVPV